MGSFADFYFVALGKLLNKQSSCRWSETHDVSLTAPLHYVKVYNAKNKIALYVGTDLQYT